MMGKPVLAAIETGGTKCLVSVGKDPNTAKRHRIETTSPRETAASIERIIRHEIGHNDLDAIGIASFGPLNVDPESADYGRIGRTPKPHWENFNLPSHLQMRRKIEVLPMRFGCPAYTPVIRAFGIYIKRAKACDANSVQVVVADFVTNNALNRRSSFAG